MRKARRWKNLWAIAHHMPTDVFDSKRDAAYFKKSWDKPGEIIRVEVVEILPKRGRR